MKESRFIQNCSRAIAAFLLTGASVVAIWSVMTFDKVDSKYCTLVTENTTEQCCTANNMVSDADMKQEKGVNLDISKLEKMRTNTMNALKKAKADRDKSHGMVAGVYYQPAQDIAEIVNLEKKIEKIDNKIAALKKDVKTISDDYSSDAQRLALR